MGHLLSQTWWTIVQPPHLHYAFGSTLFRSCCRDISNGNASFPSFHHLIPQSQHVIFRCTSLFYLLEEPGRRFLAVPVSHGHVDAVAECVQVYDEACGCDVTRNMLE